MLTQRIDINRLTNLQLQELLVAALSDLERDMHLIIGNPDALLQSNIGVSLSEIEKVMKLAFSTSSWVFKISSLEELSVQEKGLVGRGISNTIAIMKELAYLIHLERHLSTELQLIFSRLLTYTGNFVLHLVAEAGYQVFTNNINHSISAGSSAEAGLVSIAQNLGIKAKSMTQDSEGNESEINSGKELWTISSDLFLLATKIIQTRYLELASIGVSDTIPAMQPFLYFSQLLEIKSLYVTCLLVANDKEGDWAYTEPFCEAAIRNGLAVIERYKRTIRQEEFIYIARIYYCLVIFSNSIGQFTRVGEFADLCISYFSYAYQDIEAAMLDEKYTGDTPHTDILKVKFILGLRGDRDTGGEPEREFT